MKVKRNRTIKEKIEECLNDKVCNLHPELYRKLFGELLTEPVANNSENDYKSKKQMVIEDV